MVWCARVIVALAGMSVGMVAAYESMLILKATPYTMYSVLGIAVCGSALMVMAHEAWHNSAYFRMTVMALAGLVCSTYAMTSSIGGDATIKDAARGVRVTKQANEELERGRRKDALDRIAALEATVFSDRTKIGATTPEMAELAVKELKGCKCPQLAVAKQKLAVAKEVTELRKKRDGWQPITEETPSVDATIETMTTVAKDLGTAIPAQSMRASLSVWKVIGMELAGILIPIGAFAWGREPKPRRARKSFFRWLFGKFLPRNPAQDLVVASPVLPAQDLPRNPAQDFENPAPRILEDHSQDEARKILTRSQILPSILAQDSMPENPVLTAQDSPQDFENPAPGILGKILPPSDLDTASLRDVQSWVADCVDTTVPANSRILYGDAHDHYCKWCEARKKKPVSKNALGLAMAELGWPEKDLKPAQAEGAVNFRAKVGGKIWFYGASLRRNSELKPERPALALVRQAQK